MKRFYKLALAMMLVVPSVCFVSCSSDDPQSITSEGGSGDGPNAPINPNIPNADNAMSSAAQKERLESVALEVANLIPASDFNQISSLGRYISDTYCDDYDWDEVEDWAERIFDGLKTSLNKKTEENKWGGTYIYDNYKAIVAASNFTGHFTAQNGRWRKSNASDLQFSFKDQSSRECVLKLATSGNTKNVYVGDIEDYKDYEYRNGRWTEYYDRTQLTIAVPEHIVVTLTQGGSNVITANVDIDLKSISANNEFNFASNSLTASSKVELNNGYVFNASQVAYTANTKASVSCSVSKNGRSIISISAASDLSGIPDCNLSALVSDSDDLEDLDWDNANGRNAWVKIDVLGKVQVQGTLSDIRKYADYLDEADDNNSNESRFKQCINQANSLTNIYVFYDNSSTAQAKMTLEPFEESDYYGRRWYVEPTIHFFDGSSYSLENFFNENDFRRVIDAYEDLCGDYEDLIE